MKGIIFTVDGRHDLLKEVMETLSDTQITKGDINSEIFSDGEVCVDFESSVRGKRVYLLSSPNTSDKILQLNFAIDAAKRAGASEIVPIIPYFAYARQDKKDQLRGPIGAKVMAEMIENRGATSLITFDLHADQIQGFFNIPVVHMEGKYLFDRYIFDLYRDHYVGNLVLCAPDAGAGKRVKGFRDQLKSRWDIDLPMVYIDKTRIKANQVGEMNIIGEVRAKNVIIIDDMCDTAGTLVKAAEKLKEAGAMSVRSIVTHGVLSGPAYSRLLKDMHLDEFVCSNSLPISRLKSGGCDIKQITISKQIGKAIVAIQNHTSVEELKNKV